MQVYDWTSDKKQCKNYIIQKEEFASKEVEVTEFSRLIMMSVKSLNKERNNS